MLLHSMAMKYTVYDLHGSLVQSLLPVEENGNSLYNRLFLGRKGNKQLGIGFLVNKSLNVINGNLVNERSATSTVTKKDKFKSKSPPSGVKIFRIKNKQCEFFINNVHAPHMGILSSQEKKTPKLMIFLTISKKLSKASMACTSSSSHI